MRALKPMRRSHTVACLLWVACAWACADAEESWTSSGAAAASAQSSDGGQRDAAASGSQESAPDGSHEGPPVCPGGCTHFPSEPLIEPAEPPITAAEIARFANADDFAPADFCVMEPQLSSGTAPGALLPRNWLRPRVRVQGASDVALYEVRLQSALQRHALRVYTRDPAWTMPKELWAASAKALRTVTVTVRALSSRGALRGVRGTFEVAPVEVAGSLVFWATTSAEVGPTTSKLHGFSVGDEAVVELLRAGDVQTAPVLHENGRELRGEYGPKPGFAAGKVQCIGCHTTTPDGRGVIFTDDYPWSKVVTSLEAGKVGSKPAYLSAGAETLLKQPWLGVQTTSPAHFAPGDRVVVTSYGTRSEPFGPYLGGTDALAWFDLETTVSIPAEVPQDGAPGPSRDDLRAQRSAAITAAKGTAWGIIATMGEAQNAVTPSFSRDGARIVYVSTDRAPNGHPAYEASTADLKVVPYNDRAGGVAQPLAGASSPAWLEYHPSFSPDDAFVTFTRAPNRGSSPDGPYYNRNGEIFVVPSGGDDTPTRLRANDPVACAGESSPGVLNSWSKWSPKVYAHAGETYYFLVFSSARAAPGNFAIPRSQYTPGSLDTRSSQLYMAAFKVDARGAITSYPAVYLWNQNRLADGDRVVVAPTSNLTPAWDDLEVPPTLL